MRIIIAIILLLFSHFAHAEYDTNKEKLRALLEASKLDTSVKKIMAVHSLYLSQDTITRILFDDSLVIQILTSGDPKVQVNFLNRLAFLEADMGNMHNTRDILKQTALISREINYKAGMAYDGFYNGLISWEAGNTAEAEAQFIQCINQLDAEKEIMDLYSPLSAIRFFFNGTQQYEKKLKFYHDKLAYYEKNGPYENKGSCFHGIGNYHLLKGNYERAIEYYLRAGENWKSWGNETCYLIMQLVVAEKYIDWGNVAYARQLIDGVTKTSRSKIAIVDYSNYEDVRGQMASARKEYRKALQIYQGLNMVHSALGETFFILNNISIAKLYLQLNNPDSAKFHLDLVAARLNNRKGYSIWNGNGDIEYDYCMSVYNKLKGNKELAISQMKEALEKVQKEKYSKLILKYLKELSVLTASAGDTGEAFKYLNQYQSLKDSLDNIGQSNRISLYETQQREKQQDQEILKSNERNERQKIINLSIAGGFLMILVFSLVLYNRFRFSKKQTRIIAAEKEMVEHERQRAEASIEDLKATQAQLIQSEKMASLGELTAGIAHEIQNPLNFVNNFSELSKELFKELEEEMKKGNQDEVKAISFDILQNLGKIHHHGKRAESIIKGMLLHSRQTTGEKTPVDINKLVDEFLRLAYHGLRAKDRSFNATLKTDYDKSIGSLNLVEQDIGRVILNLMNNAFYAVSKKQAGDNYTPTVSASTKKLDDMVEIRVSDNGNGIPQASLDKIFQPFFTTKPPGQGTGLGLSLSYDVVHAHGGTIEVESKEGEGATFIVRLPLPHNGISNSSGLQEG